MTEEAIPRQTVQCRDLSTKSVTLYPSRAHVVREIPNITLKPGQNEVEIYGLGPMVDEDSIQIEGRGQATITDITIDLVPNRENFSDHFPEEDEESDDDDDDDLEDELPEAVKKLDEEIDAITAKAAAAREAEASAERQLGTLDKHVGTMHAKDHDASSTAAMLNMYSKERDRIYLVSSNSAQEAKKLEEMLEKKQLERLRANKDALKKKLKLQKAKAKERAKKERQKADKREEAARLRKEREKFWAKKVYKVVVRLETNTADTPGSSRRNSLDSVTLSKVTPEELDNIKVSPSKLEVSLSMSYITDSAFWTPRYDFKIQSVQKTATIVYRAELSNGTSETWKDTKIILSTSQTSFSGLDDKVPTMHPWRVRVGKAWEAGSNVQSGEEMARRSLGAAKAKSKRMNLGISLSASPAARPSAPAMQQALLSNTESVDRSGPLMSYQQVQMQMPVGGAANQHWAQGTRLQMDYKEAEAGPPAPGSFGGVVADGDDSDDNALDFEESTWEDYGMTTTYELPGARTLAPSSLPRRHKIATLQASNVAMSHIAVPKLKAAAYLRCKIRNPSSSVTLLKGQAGITLDGSFLGTTPLDRISPNQVFTVPLGVDPAIHISYPKPTSHRSTQGLFSKENATLHSRSALVTNTKGAPVELLVLDQAPVSQDEKLRVEIVEPRGLAKAGDSVKAGAPAAEGKTGWGKATATLKKDGEVAWLVNIEKGQSCVLKLGFETRLPSSDAVVTV